jgi:hypothetical protein
MIKSRLLCESYIMGSDVNVNLMDQKQYKFADYGWSFVGKKKWLRWCKDLVTTPLGRESLFF